MKRLSLILAFVLSVVFFAGCAGDGADTSETSDVANTKTDVQDVPLFTEKIAPVAGTDVTLSFLGSNTDGVYTVEKIIVKRTGGEDVIDVCAQAEQLTMLEGGASSIDPKLRYAAEDMDFDGDLDFRFQGWQTSGDSTAYLCYMWNGETYEFALDIADPIVDAANKKVYSTVTDANKEYTYVYEVSDGVLVLKDSFESGASVAFTTNIGDYEQYMAPSDRDAYLILANTESVLDAEYAPTELYNVINTRGDRNYQQMVPTAAMALEALYIEMAAYGYTDVSVTSAYRSFDRQTELFNMYLSQEMDENGYTYDEAYKVTSTYSAPPGTSEHQTGLCCDMHNLPAANVAFENEAAYTWLSENAWKFGFILRFPEDKTEITKITFEPWHYRFVGRYHAEKITKLGMCLEEYLDYLELTKS